MTTDEFRWADDAIRRRPPLDGVESRFDCPDCRLSRPSTAVPYDALGFPVCPACGYRDRFRQPTPGAASREGTRPDGGRRQGGSGASRQGGSERRDGGSRQGSSERRDGSRRQNGGRRQGGSKRRDGGGGRRGDDDHE